MLLGSKYLFIAFSDNLVKAVIAKPTTKGVKVFYSASKEIPNTVVFNGQIINEGLFSETIKSLFFENYQKFKGKKLVVGLNEQEVFLSSVEIKERPKNLTKRIEEILAPKLPFDLSETSFIYSYFEDSAICQIASTKLSVLEQLTRIFTHFDLSLVGFVPIPLLFPKIAGNQKNPYIFIFSDQQKLIIALIVKNTVAFSSTYLLKNQLAESEREVKRLVSEVIENEYTQKDFPLNRIFVLGSGASIIKSFFTEPIFNIEVANKVFESPDIAEIDQALILANYDSSIITFKATNQSTNTNSKKGRLFLFIIIILSILPFLLVFYFKDRLIESTRKILPKNKPAINTQLNQAAPSTTISPKPATSAGKPATESPKPATEINKNQFTIKILNGSGIKGAANQAKEFLIAKGWTNIVGLDNADNFNYQTSQLRIKKSKEKASELLTSELKERYSISIGVNVPEAENYDIIFIVGKN